MHSVKRQASIIFQKIHYYSKVVQISCSRNFSIAQSFFFTKLLLHLLNMIIIYIKVKNREYLEVLNVCFMWFLCASKLTELEIFGHKVQGESLGCLCNVGSSHDCFSIKMSQNSIENWHDGPVFIFKSFGKITSMFRRFMVSISWCKVADAKWTCLMMKDEGIPWKSIMNKAYFFIEMQS